jgi:hypothetical protein
MAKTYHTDGTFCGAERGDCPFQKKRKPRRPRKPEGKKTV